MRELGHLIHSLYRGRTYGFNQLTDTHIPWVPFTTDAFQGLVQVTFLAHTPLLVSDTLETYTP